MISVEKCREELGEISQHMSDEEIIKIRDNLYALGEMALDQYFENFKKQSSNTS